MRGGRNRPDFGKDESTQISREPTPFCKCVMRYFTILLLFVLAVCALADTAAFENTSVIKTVDLSEAIVKVTLRVQVRVLEGSSKEYMFAIPRSEFEHMAYIHPSSSNKLSIAVKKAPIQDR